MPPPRQMVFAAAVLLALLGPVIAQAPAPAPAEGGEARQPARPQEERGGRPLERGQAERAANDQRRLPPDS